MSLPRTPSEMAAREAEILQELQVLAVLCETATGRTYRELSDDMNALESECVMWSQIRTRLERRAGQAVPA